MSVDPSIRAQIMEVLSDPMNLPPEFWGYDVQNWMKEAPVFPISQVFGFTQFTAKSSSVATSETTASATYTDLATVGPTISGLADGQYVVLCIARMAASAIAVDTLMGVKVNSTEAADVDAAYTQSPYATSVVQGSLQTLSNAGNNTLVARYRSASGTAFFANRRLIALKYANL